MLSADFAFGSRKLSRATGSIARGEPRGAHRAVQGRKSIFVAEGQEMRGNRSLPKPLLLVTARVKMYTEKAHRCHGGRETT